MKPTRGAPEIADLSVSPSIIDAMAWEWVSPVAAAVSTGTVGVVGIWLTWRSGHDGREHAEKMATQRLAHERLMADVDRRQQRLENTYVALLDMMEKAAHWAQISYPLWDTNPPQLVPDLPSLETQAHVESLVRAFGSPDVIARMETWRQLIQKMLKLDKLIKLGLEHDVERSPRVEFAELQPLEEQARHGISVQVAQELGHRRDTAAVK